MGSFEATVESGGFLHVPYPEGTPVTIKPKKFADYTREEWITFVNDSSGSDAEFEVPERRSSPPTPSPKRAIWRGGFRLRQQETG